MFWILAILLSSWSLSLGSNLSSGIWDSIILMCWVAWPLYLCTLLITLKHRGQETKFWQLKFFGDHLLLGAYLPQIFGLILFNIQLADNIGDEARSFEENLLFVGYYTVKLWLATALSVFAFYLVAKFRMKKTTKSASE